LRPTYVFPLLLSIPFTTIIPVYILQHSNWWTAPRLLLRQHGLTLTLSRFNRAQSQHRTRQISRINKENINSVLRSSFPPTCAIAVWVLLRCITLGSSLFLFFCLKDFTFITKIKQYTVLGFHFRGCPWGDLQSVC
jgi:hypothetical protein